MHPRHRIRVPTLPDLSWQRSRLQEASLSNNIYAVTDSVLEDIYDERLINFRRAYNARFAADHQTDSDPVDRYSAYGFDAANIVLAAATGLPLEKWADEPLELRQALRAAIAATPNSRQGLLSSGGFTERQELNFVAHRQIFVDGGWHDPDYKPLPSMPTWQFVVLVTVTLLLVGLTVWQLERIRREDTRVITFILFVLISLVAALVLFATLRSYGHITGQRLGVAFEFGGPAALFVFVLLLGIWMEFRPRSTPGPFVISVLFVDTRGGVVDETGRMTIFLPQGSKEYAIRKGQAVLADLPGSLRNITVAYSLTLPRAVKKGTKQEIRLTPDLEHRITLH